MISLEGVWFSKGALTICVFFFSSRRRHTRFSRDWSSDVCSSDLESQPSPEPTKAQDAEEPIPEDLESPDSMTVIVNKLRPLPEDFAPDDLVELPDQMGTDTYELREPAAEAAKELFAAAREDGIELTVVSAYRSYAYQQELYDNYIAEHGSEVTNEMSAMPGHSEHQTGLALDVDSPDGQHTLQQSF